MSTVKCQADQVQAYYSRIGCAAPENGRGGVDVKERKDLRAYWSDCLGYTSVIVDRVLPKVLHLLFVAGLVLILVLGTRLA